MTAGLNGTRVMQAGDVVIEHTDSTEVDLSVCLGNGHSVALKVRRSLNRSQIELEWRDPGDVTGPREKTKPRRQVRLFKGTVNRDAHALIEPPS